MTTRHYRHNSRNRFHSVISISLIVLLVSLLMPGPVAAQALQSSGQVVLGWQQQLSSYLDWLTKRSVKPQESGRRGVKPATPESKEEKQGRVASIEISPRNEVTLKSREPMIFTGIPLDSQGGTVQGLTCDWRSLNNEVIFVQKNGTAMAGNPGTAELVVQAGNKSRRVKVTVVNNPSHEKYPAKKQSSQRTETGTVGKTVPGPGNGVAANTKSEQKRAHASRPYSPAAPMPMRPPNDDPLPDNESTSLYDQSNLIGNPSGKKKAGAMTASVAAESVENGNKNFSFGLPVMSLGGRGIDVSLGLVYNSLLWNKSVNPSTSATWLTYDVDSGYPAQGFRLGFGQIEDQGSAGFTYTDAAGTRHALIHVTGSEYKSNDGTFLQFFGGGGYGTLIQANGTRITYGFAGGGYRMYPSSIIDINGNYITISYLNNVGPRIETVVDTMGRYVRFYYDSNDELVTVTVPGFNGGSDLQVMRFYYDNISISSASSLFNTGVVNVTTTPSSIRGIKYIYLPASAEGSSSSDGDTGYRFDYSPYGMIRQITRFQGMTASTTSTSSTGTVTEGTNTTAATTTYNYPTSASSLTDAPTYTQRTDDWAGRTTGSAPVYTFATSESSTEVLARVTAPDGSVSETVSIKNSGQWDDGLVKETRIQDIATPSPSPSPTATPVVYGKNVITWEQSYTNGPPRIADTRQTNEAGKTRATVYSYDTSTPYNNVSVVSERDFTTNGTVSGTELRKTVTTYVTSSSYLDKRILHLPSSIRILPGGSSTVLARVDYEYDNYGTSHANMTPRSDIIMHYADHDPFQEDQEIWDWVCVAWHHVGDELICTMSEWQQVGTFNPYDPATDYRGNVTRITTYTDAPGASGAITRDRGYDIAGNATTMEVNCCQEQTIAYTKTYEYAYPTAVTKGDPGGLHLTNSTAYDFNTGVVSTVTDPNSQVTSLSYNSDTVRIAQVDAADGGRITYDYADALVADSASKYHSLMTVTTKLDASRNIDSKSYLDGRGEVAATFDSYTSGDGWSIRNIEYDNMGRAYRVSNPYYSTSNYGTVAINSSGIWTTSTFDLLGRTTQTQMPRGDDSNPTQVNTLSSTYAGEVTTVTDQAGKVRRSLTDAMGRLIRLDEPTTSGLGTVSSPNQSTTYDYDLLDNLVKITQGSQSRYFMYDSLSRLIRERLAEQVTNSSYNLSDSLTGNSSWTKKFEYNSYGLITDVYDALGQQTEFSYDALNRLTLIDYPGSTPDSRYYYDSTSNLPSGYPSYTVGYPNGRLVGMTYGSSGSALAGTYFGYDKLGRVTEQRQKTGSNTFSLSYTYNHAGLLATETYPTGRVLTHSYDNAGRLSQISDGTTTFTSGLTYAASGSMLSETWGNSAVHSAAYNNALQVKEIKLKQSSAGAELQRFDYLYGEVNQSNGSVDLTKNYGQIGRLDGVIGGTKQWEQRYSYDEVGRLSTAAEFYSSGFTTSAWQQQFTFDRYGNRFQSGGGNTGAGFTPVISTDITASTNRFISTGSTPVTYDDAGNITQDMKFRLDAQGNGMIYSYDPNGRQLSAKRSDDTAILTSIYDGAGQRVQTSGDSVVRQMVYDIFGQLVEDYRADASGTAQMTGVERENIYRGGQLLAVYESDICYKSLGNFVADFYVGAFGAGATTTYATDIATWTVTLTKAQAQSTAALLGAAQQMGNSVFTSSAYTSLGTSDGQYVNDLYEAYLQRAGDSGGVGFWTGQVGANGRTAVRQAFVLSIEFGEKVAKLCAGTNGSTSTSANLKYVLSDVQGSARVLMENNSTSSAILARHDYLPYGEDIAAGIGSRTTGQKYSISDKVRQRFAMTERDEASGLDHTLYRKYDSFAGRWTSPDIYGGTLFDPQSLNRFSYAVNDPVNRIDPSGLMPCVPGNYSAECGMSGFGGWGGGFNMNERPSAGRAIIAEAEKAWDITLRRYGRWLEGVDRGWASDFNSPEMDEIRLDTCNEDSTGALASLSRESTYTTQPVATQTPGSPPVRPVFSPDFSRRLSSAIIEMNSIGIVPQINSGFRTEADQQWFRTHGANGNPVNQGISDHQTGTAVDINGLTSTMRDILKKNGLSPVNGDPPHFKITPDNKEKLAPRAEEYYLKHCQNLLSDPTPQP
jgi:RHS repeat-associated protein